METVTMTYKITPEKEGYFVECLDWDCVFSQGETVKECKNNIIEVTEMFLTSLISKELHPNQYPHIQKHLASPFTFHLSFNMETGKFINLSRIKRWKNLKPTSNLHLFL
jgi:predicted RNase H-like HicB family nuclease